MSAALATTEPAAQPDPDRAARPAYGPRRFASLLRSIIEFGKHLDIALRLRAQRLDFPRFTKPFATSYLPDILRRIDGAVRRALVLEEHALQQAGLWPLPRVRAASAGQSRAARRDDDAPCAPPAPKRAARPARPSGDPHYAGWPTIKQLAAEIRSRPVAAVLMDICRDLGITPHHWFWAEMRAAIVAHGGSVEELEHDAGERWCSRRWLAIPFTEPHVSTLRFWPAPWSDPLMAAAAVTATAGVTATGPP